MAKKPTSRRDRKDRLRQSRNQPFSLKLDLSEGDEIQESIPRENGLFIVSSEKIFRVRTPDDIDPELDHADAPWVQNVHLPHGSSDPLVARTIIQTKRLAENAFAQSSDEYAALLDTSWEMMNSLVSLRLIKERLEGNIREVCEEIEGNIEKYTREKNPSPLPLLEYFDICHYWSILTLNFGPFAMRC